MGMYTKLHCNIKIKKEATECIKILKYMLGDVDAIDFEIPNHDLFKQPTQRWDMMLTCDSFYFTGTQNSSLKDDGIGGHVLHCDCDLKDYEDEINLFLDWISQYADYNDLYVLVGYEIYEENNVPNLIYFGNNKFKKIYLGEKLYEDLIVEEDNEN